MHLKDGIIVGEKIELRPIEISDTSNIIKWRNNESVRTKFIYREKFTEESHLNWLNKKVRTGEVVQFIICEKDNNRDIGSVYFRDVDSNNNKAEYGIFIGEDDALGKGYGTECAKLAVKYAFEELKIHKLMLRVFSDNINAIKSYENAGFIKEAYLKDEVFIDNVYRDIILMAVINK